MERFIICRASAGSGKTYTLVRQYIETAIASPSQTESRFKHILAITFTNKAANGMKERVMSQLHKIATDNPDADNLVAEISSHLSIDNDETRRRCSILLSSILHNYSDFAICTIDSFVHRLVRTFALDLQMPMNFSLSIDNKKIISTAVSDLLSKAGTTDYDDLTKVLCSFMESRMADNKNFKIEDKIENLAKEIFEEDAPAYLAELNKIDIKKYLEIQSQLYGENKKFEKTISGAAKEFVDDCSKTGLTIDDFPNKKSGILPFFIRLANNDFSKINDPHARVREAFSKKDIACKSTPDDIKVKLDAVLPSFMKAYDIIGSLIEKELTEYNTRKLLLANIYGLALLGHVNQLKELYYKENDIVHISEFNKRISNEVMNEPAPFIYERIGNRYYNYLIDEFQDTSKMQWLNFLPLIDEAMSRQYNDDTSECGMQSLVVGDGKQAIYRFRQGDVRQFMRLPKVESDLHGKTLAYNSKVNELKYNYRTRSNIVEFNNRFFEKTISKYFNNNPELTELYLGEKEEYESYGPRLQQKWKKEGGYVQASFTEKETLYDDVVNAIRHQKEDCNYNYSDIMVLARRNNILVSIAEKLTAAGIPIVSSESFILSNSKVILLMKSIMEYLVDPQDRVASLQVLQLSVGCGCIAPDDSLLWQLREKKFKVEEILNRQGIDFNFDYMRSLPLYDCCEHILRVFRLEGKESGYVATLLDVANKFQRNNLAELSEFTNYLNENIDKMSSSTSSDMDAVNLMTIHKAKGLESKIVIYVLPYIISRGDQMWVRVDDNEQLGLPVAYVSKIKSPTLFNNIFMEEDRLLEMDQINVLYVAMTRAEEKLLVFCENNESEKNKNKNKDNKKDNITLLHDFVKTDSLTQKYNNGESNKEIYIIGEDSIKHSSPEVKENTHSIIEVDDLVFPKWEGRVIVAANNAVLLSPLESDSRRYGILIHDLLSQIRTMDDVDSVVNNYCLEHHLQDSVRDSILKRIKNMINSDDNRRYFDPSYEVACEESIVINGEIRRPDRIVFGTDSTWVVDFKTGARDDETHKHYERQVGEYAAALTAMGYHNVKPVIIYL
ncbi:MAG: UvrD-helicase domain-containing protein [Bacteroidales bacterium]|nr:UvrD-helicase domain-containing protein [Bacteroidales bacterium]